MTNYDFSFIRGMCWATVFSVPLWISFFGWLKLVGMVWAVM
ncbi:hypothetical protein ABES25_14960 [Bacillus gobiensis]